MTLWAGDGPDEGPGLEADVAGEGDVTMAVPRIHSAPLRVAMISMHTSPLDQPGTGDAGGMNVYIAQTARRIADSGATVDVFTRATSSRRPEIVDLAEGVRVHHLPAGPYQGLRKEDLPGQVCPFTAELLRVCARVPEDYYDIVHSHYWLSGQAGWLAAQRWSIPLVHSMHTMAKVKNAHLAVTDSPDPLIRVVGEEQLTGVADRLIANTSDERRELIHWYGAAPERTTVVHPGVDLATFTPRDRAAARERVGLPADEQVIVFVGRIQPLKAPDLLVRAVARMTASDPTRPVRLVVCGGPSGSGLARPDELVGLARDLSVSDRVELRPPVSPTELADLYAAADLVAVPSYSESFGLVAVEAQACGTPVVAAAVGGLRTAVADGVGGLLVDGHDPDVWAGSLSALLDQPRLRAALAAGARAHAEKFSWSATAAGTLAVYDDALAGRRSRTLRAVN
ncbi:MAG: D-inositol-3-phosphate glycosyltransferase [Candidatus Nanopelagicales bacterium]